MIFFAFLGGFLTLQCAYCALLCFSPRNDGNKGMPALLFFLGCLGPIMLFSSISGSVSGKDYVSLVLSLIITVAVVFVIIKWMVIPFVKNDSSRYDENGKRIKKERQPMDRGVKITLIFVACCLAFITFISVMMYNLTN